MTEEPYMKLIREKFDSDYAEEYFDKDKILAMLDKEYLKKEGNWRKVWNIFIFLVWYEEFFV